jgi:hypothetical protein
MKFAWSPALVLAIVASGCTPTQAIYVNWRPAFVDTIRVNAPTRFKSYGAEELLALDARQAPNAVEILFEHHVDWTHIPTGEIEYLIAPGPPKHRRGQYALIGALLGGVTLSKVASSSTKKACRDGGCSFSATGIASANGFMLGALGGAFAGLMAGNSPRPTKNRYTMLAPRGSR